MKTDEVRDYTATMFNVPEWVALRYEWRSPLWQWQHVPTSRRLPCRVRAVTQGSARPLLEVMAERAFFQLDLAFLRRLGRYLGMPVGPGATVCEAASGLIMGVLKCTELQVCDALKRRAGMQDFGAMFHSELCELEEVQQVLDRNDLEAFTENKQTAERELHDNKVFLTEVGAKVSRARVAAAKAAAKASSRRKRQQANTPSLPGNRLPAITTIEQKDACKWAPLGGSLWLGKFQGGTWQAHYPPFRRVSRSFVKWGGEREALRLCLIYLWERHCESDGIPFAECPLKWGCLTARPSWRASPPRRPQGAPLEPKVVAPVSACRGIPDSMQKGMARPTGQLGSFQHAFCTSKPVIFQQTFELGLPSSAGHAFFQPIGKCGIRRVGFPSLPGPLVRSGK